MIEYIYFVKCPNCEDEHFDFFDEAKEYAMGCLSKKPIITQVEVCRNDFGECTDSKDLGTIWSSDYVIADVDKEPSDTPSLLTKDFLNKVGTEEDPEFAALDNSVDAEEPVEEPAGEPGETSEISEISAIDEVPDNFRKPLIEASEYDLSALVADSINHLVNDLGKDPWSEDFADEVAHDLENNYDVEAVDDPLNYSHWFDAVASEVSRQVNRDYGKTTLEENFGLYFKKKEDWDEFKKLCDEIGIYTMGDVESFMRQEGATPNNILDKLREYRAELGPDFKIKECAEIKSISEDFDPVKAAAQCSRKCYDFYKAVAARSSITALKPYAKAAAKFVKDTYGLTGAEAEELLWNGYVVWKQLNEETQRKPVPEDMTIEQLVETMEENEDEVECTWCNELYPKDECRYEVNLGYLCSRCEAAIKSRGETLTFRENNYWDFLDEEVEPVEDSKTRYWMCWFDGGDVCVLEADSEDDAETQFIDSYSDEFYFNSWNHDWSVEEISKEEYDEYLNDSLEEDMTLTEGPYDYEHIAALVDTKQQILDQLQTDARFTKCFIDGQLHATYYRRAPGSYSGTNHDETITDFEFTPEGRMIITLTTFLRDTTRVRKLDLETVLSNAARSMSSYAFLKELRDIARDLNRKHKPSVSTRRDINVFEALTSNPAVAEELKNYIKKIEYRIPLLEAYPEEFQVDKAGEPLTEKARKKLEDIYSNFTKLPYADAAIDAGLVKNRPASEDTNHNIENSWACVGNITFDCPISDLSLAAQEIIAGAKLKTDIDLKTDTYTTSCYRLINALAKYYDNNIFFFAGEAEPLTASLDTEKPLTEVTKMTKDELIAKEGTDDVDLINAGREPEDRVELVEDYGMIDCPECGAKKTFDPETGVCNNCGHIA